MQVWLPLPYRYVKTCLRGICLRSLQAVPGTDPPSPDSQHIPIPRLSLKLSPDAMDLLRNCCFFCWMNICQKIFRIFQPNCFLLEEETEKAVGSFLAHCCSASNVKKKKKKRKEKKSKSGDVSVSWSLIWNQGELCLKSPWRCRPTPAATLAADKGDSSRAVFWLFRGAQQRHSFALSWLFCFFLVHFSQAVL